MFEIIKHYSYVWNLPLGCPTISSKNATWVIYHDISADYCTRLIISTRWRFLFYPFSSRPSRLYWVNFLLHWVNFLLHWVNHFLFFFVYLQCNVAWCILLMLDQISTVLARKNDVLSLVLKLNRLACILKHGTPPTAKVTLGRFSLDFVNRQIYWDK
jgi:hypothetical protein